MKKFNKKILEAAEKVLELPILPDMFIFYNVIYSTEKEEDLILSEQPFKIKIIWLNKNTFKSIRFVEKDFDYYKKCSDAKEKHNMTVNKINYQSHTLFTFNEVSLIVEGNNYEGFFSLKDLEDAYNLCVSKITKLKFSKSPNSIKYIVEEEG